MRLVVFATLPFGSPEDKVQGVQGAQGNTNKHNEHNKNLEDRVSPLSAGSGEIFHCHGSCVNESLHMTFFLGKKLKTQMKDAKKCRDAK